MPKSSAADRRLRLSVETAHSVTAGDAQLGAPLQHIPRPKRINLMGISCAVFTSVSTIAVENYADMARRRLSANLTVNPDFVQPIERAQKQATQCISDTSAR